METEKKLVACEWCGNGIPVSVFIASKRYRARGLCGKCQENAGLNVVFKRNGSVFVQPGKEIFNSGE